MIRPLLSDDAIYIEDATCIREGDKAILVRDRRRRGRPCRQAVVRGKRKAGLNFSFFFSESLL